MRKTKKKSSKEEVRKEKKAHGAAPTEEKIQPSKEQESPDYGGIPMRDLKKNLGCG